jgi:hypothetical protein
VDAEALKAQKEKLEQDVRNLKSTFQRRESQLEQTWKQKERALSAELEKARLSTMDEETRKAYLSEVAQNRMSELEAELAQSRQQNESLMIYQNAYNQFRQAGVPDSALVTDGTTDDLVNSGWAYLTNRVKELEAKLNTPAAPAAPAPLPSAPPVDKSTPSNPAPSKMTWADWKAKGIDREQVYQLFEANKISADQIPDR